MNHIFKANNKETKMRSIDIEPDIVLCTGYFSFHVV